MQALLNTALAVLTVCAALLLPAGAAAAAPTGAAPGGTATAGTWSLVNVPGAVIAETTPTDSATPSGPVDSGTGETQQAKETRVDYAPYVIAGALIIALAGAALVWRRGRGGPSSKDARRVSHPTGEGRNPNDRGTDH